MKRAAIATLLGLSLSQSGWANGDKFRDCLREGKSGSTCAIKFVPKSQQGLVRGGEWHLDRDLFGIWLFDGIGARNPYRVP